MMLPETYIRILRSLYGGGVYSDRSGGCLKLYILLKQAYPQAKGYYNGDHIITEIDGIYYDIETVSGYLERDYLPLSHYGRFYFQEAFKELLSPFMLNTLIL